MKVTVLDWHWLINYLFLRYFFPQVATTWFSPFFEFSLWKLGCRGNRNPTDWQGFSISFLHMSSELVLVPNIVATFVLGAQTFFFFGVSMLGLESMTLRTRSRQNISIGDTNVRMRAIVLEWHWVIITLLKTFPKVATTCFVILYTLILLLFTPYTK